MGLLILKRSDRMNRYDQVSVDTASDCLLNNFLDNMVGQGDIEYYKKWLNNKNEKFGGDNYLDLQKHEGNIYITLDLGESDELDECEIPIPTFAKMLGDWSDILKKQPAYIVVIHDGASITIQGYDQDPSNSVKKLTD